MNLDDEKEKKKREIQKKIHYVWEYFPYLRFFVVVASILLFYSRFDYRPELKC